MSKIYKLIFLKTKLQKLIFGTLFFAITLANYSISFAQYKVIRTEGFDGTQYPPFGWIGGKISGNDVENYTERVTAGTNPVCGTHLASAGMLRYRSGFMQNLSFGEKYFVASPAYDLTNNPGTATVSFWMYRDNTLPTQNDSVTLYINNNPSADATKRTIIGPISRVSGAAGAWAQYTAVIPPGFNNSSAYLVFVFTKGGNNAASANIYIDNFSVETYPKQQLIISNTMHYQELSDINKGSVDQLIVGIKVVCDGAGDSLKLDSIVTNATGTTNLSDLVASSSKIWFTKGTSSPIFNVNNQFGGNHTATTSRDTFTPPAFYLENGENYFWATVSVTAGATSLNYVDVDFNGIGVRRWNGGVNLASLPLVSSIVGARQIEVALCGGVIPTLTVGTSWLNGSYSNNDYIQRVYLRGAQISFPTYPYIDNDINANGPFGQSYLVPYTVQPPSYEQLPVVSPNIIKQPHTSAVLVQGVNYTAPLFAPPSGNGGLALQCGTWSSSNYMAAWIDFNKNGSLADPGEQIIQSGPMNATTWCFAAVNVPVGATKGNVKMRVREVFANSAIQPCVSGYTFGEIEDYTISIIPSCPTGVKLWLGYTDDWNTPSNWCGGVPTIADIALIDEVGYLAPFNQTGAPFDPVIHSGTVAVAKSIRISSTDTLTINAPTSASLTVADSLTISYNTPAGGGGKVIVKSSFIDSAQVSVVAGAPAFAITPFQRSKKQMKMQMIFTKADLLSKGLIAGDIIDSLVFHFRPNANIAHRFNGYTIKYATVDSTWSKFPPPGVTPGCFGQAGTVWAPNTSAYETIFLDSLVMPASVSKKFIPLIANKMIWNGQSDIVMEFCFDNATLPVQPTLAFDDLITQTQTTNSYQVAWANSTGSTPSGCSLGAISASAGGPAGVVCVSNQYRPNITFMFHRPFTKFPINITGSGVTTAGSWVNHGIFTGGKSVVTFNNNSLNQTIGGANVTTFSDLAINKTGALATQRVQMLLNANVDTALTLTAGYLDLNQRTLTINNSIAGAITRTSGWILSESLSPNYGIVSWNIGTNSLLHTYPFGTGTGAYIPVEYTNTSAANIGTLSVATYKTSTNANVPYPAAAGPFAIAVQHMNGQGYAVPTDISISDVVDRFWQINKSVPGTVNATLRLSYAPGVPATGEEPTGGPYTYTAQRFQVPGGLGSSFGGWANRGGTNTSGSVNASIVSDSISGPWTLSNFSNPLPVELLNFDAKLVKDKVKIWWSTASEKDNDYFTVERTLNGNEYDFIASLKSKGPSSQTLDYETYDLNPMLGLQYYRLKTTDIGGNHDYSKLVPIRYSKDGEFAINAITPNYSSNSLDVWFNYDSNESYTYSVVDILGRTLVTKSGNAGTPGINNKVTIPVNMNKGIYFVVIENTHKKVASKVVY